MLQGKENEVRSGERMESMTDRPAPLTPLPDGYAGWGIVPSRVEIRSAGVTV